MRIGVTCRCGKRYLVWSCNRSILPPVIPPYTSSRFALDTLSTLPFSFLFNIILSTFSTLSSRRFYAISPLHHALRCVSIRIYIDRSTVTIFIFHEVSFLSFIRCSLRSFHLSQCIHFLTCLPPTASPLPFSFSRRVLPISRLNPYSSASTSEPLPTSNCDDLDLRSYRSMLHDAVMSFAVLPYSNSEPAASGSFSSPAARRC